MVSVVCVLCAWLGQDMPLMLSLLDPLSYDFVSLANAFNVNHNFRRSADDVANMGTEEVGHIHSFWTQVGLEKWIPEAPLREVRAVEYVMPPSASFCPLPSALCPLPSALCPLPSALCPLPSVLCPLPSAL
jgi:hypothetical protein